MGLIYEAALKKKIITLCHSPPTPPRLAGLFLPSSKSAPRSQEGMWPKEVKGETRRGLPWERRSLEMLDSVSFTFSLASIAVHVCLLHGKCPVDIY